MLSDRNAVVEAGVGEGVSPKRRPVIKKITKSFGAEPEEALLWPCPRSWDSGNAITARRWTGHSSCGAFEFRSHI